MRSERTKKMVVLAAMAAIAYVAMLLIHIPLMPGAPFLWYDPKDVIITIGGFIFGPLSSIAISLVVSLAEMFTVSDTGIIGFVMNVISSVSFAGIAALVYKKKSTLGGAVVGLVLGCLAATGMMLLWNYFITPLYMGMPREAVAAMLVPIFLPFNLIKGTLNAVITLVLYKPLVTALRKAKLVPPSQNPEGNKMNPVYLIVFAVLLVACVVAVWLLLR